MRTPMFVVLFAGALLVGLAPAAGADGLVALTATNNLLFFTSTAPTTILATVPVTGLQSGENLLGIDFRPANDRLYGLGSTSRLYVIEPRTGVATQVGSAGAFALNGTDFGFDFNPVVDRIRVVSNLDQNLRLNPDTGALAGTDSPLAYAVGDPNAGANPNVVASAYSRNFPGTTGTTLFGIDSSLDILVIQDPPNNGTLNTVGALGVDTSAQAGFDIARSGGLAYASLTVGVTPQLYTISLTSGAATLVGTIGDGSTAIRGLAVVPQQRILLTGAGPGGGPHVQVFDRSGAVLFSFFSFAQAFTGGAHVAACDVNGDGFPDIVVGAGAGGGPHVRVFDGLTGQQQAGPLGSFFAFPAAFTGGVFVGCADLDGDGKGDVIVAAGPGGGPHVRVLSGATGAELPAPLGSFFAYDAGFTGGVFVGGNSP